MMDLESFDMIHCRTTGDILGLAADPDTIKISRDTELFFEERFHGGVGGFFGREKMEMAQVLFDLLNTDKRFEWVFLPVAIDGSTGAGIYITGKEYFSEVESLCGAPDLKEVKKWYEAARDDGSLYDAYRENNMKPPQGVPEPFLKYFFHEEDTWDGEPMEEEIRETKAELDAAYEKSEKNKKGNKPLKRGGDPGQRRSG